VTIHPLPVPEADSDCTGFIGHVDCDEPVPPPTGSFDAFFAPAVLGFDEDHDFANAYDAFFIHRSNSGPINGDLTPGDGGPSGNPDFGHNDHHGGGPTFDPPYLGPGGGGGGGDPGNPDGAPFGPRPDLGPGGGGIPGGAPGGGGGGIFIW
jgi:hypothetical protein